MRGQISWIRVVHGVESLWSQIETSLACKYFYLFFACLRLKGEITFPSPSVQVVQEDVSKSFLRPAPHQSYCFLFVLAGPAKLSMTVTGLNKIVHHILPVYDFMGVE